MDVSRELSEVTIQGGGAPTSRVPFLADGRLSFAEWIAIVDEIAEIAPTSSSLRLTEFDLRPRSIRLVEYASVRKRRPVLEIDVADETLRERLEDLAKLDLKAVSFPIDDLGPTRGDSVVQKRSWHGSIYGAIWARDLGVPVEIRTLVRPGLVERLGPMYELVKRIGASRWKLDLIGQVTGSGLLGAPETEKAFTNLINVMTRTGPVIEIHEGPSMRRSLMERSKKGGAAAGIDPDAGRIEIRTSRGKLFVSRDGTITPGRSLPIAVGQARHEEVRNVLFRSELLRAIHDPSRLRGKCGECELNSLCGGSRARAWVVSGDPLSADPGCPWDGSAVLPVLESQTA